MSGAEVPAAVEAFWANEDALYIEYAMRNALEAAAPYISAAAWDACANMPTRPRPEDNPYRSQS